MSKLKAQKNYIESGQALLFVVITMTIALALGIGLSLETINSISNVTETDTSQRAIAAAEGAAERVLTLDNSTLADLEGNNMNQTRCENILEGEWEDGVCYVTFSTGSRGIDSVKVRASVQVSEYSVTDESANKSDIQINANDVKEIFLEGYTQDNVDICWDGNSEIYYKVYNESGDIVNKIVQCSDGNCNSWNYGASEVAQTGQSLNHPDYDHCHRVGVQSGSGGVDSPKGLRVRALGSTIGKGAIFPDPGLPVQGYKIETQGELVDVEGATRDVTVFKSFSYVPAVFDFTFYSKDNLSL